MAVNIDLNKKGWQKLFSKANFDLIDNQAIGAMNALGMECVVRADQNREFTQFTGQTVSSYMAGVYKQGKVENTLSDLPNTVHEKIGKGESLYLKNPVEGDDREYTGQVDLATKEGIELSERTIKEFKPKTRYAMLVTTGTEYSEYLEKVQDMDVLTKTYEDMVHEGRKELKQLMTINE